ncbi:hypothetical protein ACWEQL_36830 [Kitasatospora sp. NPDC004240]
MSTTTAATVTDGSRVRLHDLVIRPDGTEWLVGRTATGVVVALPETGVRAVRLLADGHRVDETARALAAAGPPVDVTGFVHELAALGFVRTVDGAPVPAGPPPRPSLARLRPRHLRWVLGPLPPVLLALLVTGATAAAVREPALLPGYRDLLWNPSGGLVLGSVLAVSWLLVLLHELGHLLVGRALGLPARLGLGTRMQFLVAQTDLSGIELAPRRHRLTGYLAGIAVNLAVAATALLAAAAYGADHRLPPALALLSLAQIPFQLLVFLRTDVYFVLQDLTHCRDLRDDGARYLRHLLRRATRRRTTGDPTAGLPAGERRAVRIHAAVLAVGTAASLALLAAVTVPADLALIRAAAGRLGPGHTWPERLDALLVLVLLAGTQLLWAVTRRRGRRARRRHPGGRADSATLEGHPSQPSPTTPRAGPDARDTSSRRKGS